MNALTLAKLEAQLNLQIAKLEVERCVAIIDHLNAEPAGTVVAEAKTEAKTEAKPAPEAKPEAKTKAAGKKAADDIAKVKAAAEKAVKQPTPEEMGIDTSDTTEVLGYKEGTYDVLGNFNNLKHLPKEARAKYVAGMVPNIDHAKAMKEGVMNLELVNEVIDALDTEFEVTPLKLPNSPGIEAIAKVIGADLLQHIADRAGTSGVTADAKVIYDAIKAGA